MIEMLGIVASCFVLLSFIFKDVKIIRMVNIVGATLFVLYGAIINALSVWLLNGVLMIVHIYYLTRKSEVNHNEKNHINKD